VPDLHDVGALLLKWKEQNQFVSVQFVGNLSNVFSLSCTGRVTHIFLTRFGVSSSGFAVSWGNGASIEFRYDNAKLEISEDGRTLRLVYSLSESLVVSEVVSA